MIEPRLTNSRRPQELLESIQRHLLSEEGHDARESRWQWAAWFARYDIYSLVRKAYDGRPTRRKARRTQHG